MSVVLLYTVKVLLLRTSVHHTLEMLHFLWPLLRSFEFLILSKKRVILTQCSRCRIREKNMGPISKLSPQGGKISNKIWTHYRAVLEILIRGNLERRKLYFRVLRTNLTQRWKNKEYFKNISRLKFMDETKNSFQKRKIISLKKYFMEM